MGVANSNCMGQNDVDKSVNGVQDKDVLLSAPPDSKTSGRKMEDEGDCLPVASATDEEPGKRRHSTPTCGTTHLSRLGAYSPGESDVRWRRSGSTAPRRVNKPTKDDLRRTALPPWAKAVRSSHGDSSTSLQCRSAGGAMAEPGHDAVRSETTANDASCRATSVGRRREFQQTNYPTGEGLDRVDSTGCGGRFSGIRFESQMNRDTSSSPPPRNHIPSSQHQSAGQARPSQQRRSSIAFLPVSESSTASSMFSSKSTATKDRLSLGFGNASDLVASLIGSRSPDPPAGATQDQFWVPPTIWKKTRALSLVPQKMSTDAKVIPGKPSRYPLCNQYFLLVIHSFTHPFIYISACYSQQGKY